MPILSWAEEKKDIKVVEVEKATLQDIAQTVRLIGTVQAKRSTVLIAKTVGTLGYAAYAGQEISKENLIATLENVDVEEIYLLAVSAQRNAKDQYDRIIRLEKLGLAKKPDVEDRKNQWIEAQRHLKEAKIDLDKTRFTAPFDGVVGSFKVRAGAQVQIGDTIATFYDPSELIVEFDILTPILKKIQRDGKAQEAVIDCKTVTVPHIQRMIDPDTHMSPAYVDFPCEDCIIGSHITIDLVVAKLSQVLVIPHETVFLREGKTYVYVVKDDKATLRPVTLGIREKNRVEITSGLSVGELVIIRGQGRLYPDIEVKIFDGKRSDSSKSPIKQVSISEKKSTSS